MSVFVVGLNGCRLMPVSERKARLLLKGGKASIYRKVPFTIKLNYKTGSTVQPGYLGIDTGSQHIGVSVVQKDGTVLHKEEIGLRDSMSKRKLLESRASSRRGRPGTGTRSGSQRQSVPTMRRQTGKDGTGRNRRTRSLPKDRQDGCRHPCSPKRTIISSGSGNSWTFFRKDTGFPSNWAVLTRPG